LEWRTATLASNASYVIDAVEKFSSAAVTNLQVTAPLTASVIAGSPSLLSFQVRNLTATATTVTLNSTVNLSGWTAAVQGNTTITIAANATQAVSVLVTAPGNASGTTAVVTMTATDGSGTASDFCNVTATESNVVGCHNMEGFSTMFTLVAAPTVLTYSPNAVVATKGVTNISSIPANGGGVITNYTINPALPTGVTINAFSGVISGIAAVLSTETVYTITGTNFAGSTTSTFTLTVNDVAPSNLTYSYNPINAAVNVSNITSTPTADGGPVVTYTVAPALPTGLTIDAVTGLISGISSEVVTNKSYTITATNTGGSTTCDVLITVYEGISAPNTITPNGDGINDTWMIPNVADFAGYELTIFNNLGATLYQSSNYNNDWDVKYKGNDLPAGTYYYVFIKGSTVHKGFITVLRAK
jgi:gliding motility-associated-like protein